MDYVANKAEGNNCKVGKMVILPSSFNAGPRAMKERLMDAMTIMQNFGKPDLFITLTCSPKWKEITENLRKGETTIDRPDLIAKIFHEKIKILKNEIMEKNIFVVIIAFVFVIEFQKRGLPHIHLLVYLSEECKIHDSNDVNKIVTDEISNAIKYPKLYDLVKQYMVHGPCGSINRNSPCMENNCCTKNYPRDFCEETNYNGNKGYPTYRRRNNAAKITYSYTNNSNKEVDNRFIVPYNAYLLLLFSCHVNVEICCTIKCIKYLFKYLMKGPDSALIGLSNKNNNETINCENKKIVYYDEIDEYLSTRYVCPPEAMYRLNEYKLFEMSHCIYRLAVHLENEQNVYFGKVMITVCKIKISKQR